MRVEILGNGTGFDFEQVNTSFLLESGEETWLIDCGFNLPRYLAKLKLLEKITGVAITHVHADHSGGLEILCYYWEEIKQKVNIFNVPIHSNGNVIPIDVNFFRKIVFLKPDCVRLELNSEPVFSHKFKKLEIAIFEHGFHLVCPGYMYAFKEGDWVCVFTGDTTAHPRTRELVEKLFKKYARYVTLFHDYSLSESTVHSGDELFELFSPLLEKKEFALIPIHWGAPEMCGTINSPDDAKLLSETLIKKSIPARKNK